MSPRNKAWFTNGIYVYVPGELQQLHYTIDQYGVHDPNMAIVDLATKQSASYIRPTSWADVSIISNPPHVVKPALTSVSF